MLPNLDTDTRSTVYPLPPRLDILNSAAVGAAIGAAISDANGAVIGERFEGAPQALILDARDLTYISSKGVHTLRRLRKKLQAGGGALTIAGPRRFAREVLIHGGLKEILKPTDADSSRAR